VVDFAQLTKKRVDIVSLVIISPSGDPRKAATPKAARLSHEAVRRDRRAVNVLGPHAMQMNDIQRAPASKAKVWAAINDPESLKRCIPGCQSLAMTSPTEMTATVVVEVGPVKATFSGKVNLSDLDPPNGYRIAGEGSGGVAGFAKGGATVKLEAESADVTNLQYVVDARVGGKLAQLGGRLIDSTAKRLAEEFFPKFRGRADGARNAQIRRGGERNRERIEARLAEGATFVTAGRSHLACHRRCQANVGPGTSRRQTSARSVGAE
jgi:carbon monoxide dehydrogenase subunit G